MRPQPTTPTSLQTEMTPSSASRWTQPCPVPLVRWGSPGKKQKGASVLLSKGSGGGKYYMTVIYVPENANGCSIRSLWRDSTNCLLLMFTPFLVIDSSLSMCYFLLPFYPSATSAFFLTSLSYVFHPSFSCCASCPSSLPSSSSLFLGSFLLLFPFAVPTRFPCSPWCWPPACVYVCVCSCARPDLPEQWAPARLVTPGRRCRWEQQRHAGHRGRSGVLCAAVSCHQLPLLCVWIGLWQHEWWESKFWPWCLSALFQDRTGMIEIFSSCLMKLLNSTFCPFVPLPNCCLNTQYNNILE